MTMRNKIQGFTLVELLLSMTFLAFLLLAIATLTLQMTGIFNKGLTLREANQAGQFISNEIQRSLNQTYTEQVNTDAINFSHDSGGRLCSGGSVFAWNYPDENGRFSGGTSAINALNGSSDVRFVKFSGTVDDYCKQQSDGSWKPLPSSASELLPPGNANIAIHSMTIGTSEVEGDSTQTIYLVSTVVGTTEVGLLTVDSERCKGVDKKGDEWCAVNKFSFTARSGNKEDSL